MAVSLVAVLMPGETQNAVANGDTRTIQLYHAHTKESITATYLIDGSYDQSVLTKLNWFLRDWRRDEPTKMDPRLFDTIWEVYRESGSRQPVEVMSAYRSPETNAMLRRRSRGVAEHSQHILGKAMDQHYFDVPMSKIREIAMRLQRGGVGFYPTAGTPFVHMDVGGVRHWPRMSYDQLARLFPDGKTVHIPSNGQPLARYEEARAELESRGGESYPTAGQIKSKGFFAWLFGGGGDEEEDAAASAVADRGRGSARNTRVAMADRGAGAAPVASYDSSSKSGGTWAFLSSQQRPSAPPSTPYGRAASEAPRAPLAAAPAPIPAAPPAEAKLALAMSMDERNSRQQAIQQPQLVAAAPAVPNLVVPPQALMDSGLAVPTPPRRPVELADLDPDLPMPPVKPSELSRPVEAPAPTAALNARLAKADGISVLLNDRSRQGGLPAVITQGTMRWQAGPAPAVLAYAGPASAAEQRSAPVVPMPVPRPSDLVSARLDRSNFRSLTSVAKTDKTTTRSALGTPVVGIRAASRATLGTFASNGGTVTTFGAKASDLTTDRFSGTAPKPSQTIVTAKRADVARANND